MQAKQPGQTLTVTIREIHQRGPLAHVVLFDAEIELLTDETTVAIELIDLPPGLDESGMYIPECLGFIREGVEEALQPHGLGAFVLVSNLSLHDVDYSARKFKQYTRQYVEAALKEPGPIPDA